MKQRLFELSGIKKNNEVLFTYGIVRDIDSKTEDEDLKEVFESDTEIIAIKRLHKKCEDGK